MASSDMGDLYPDRQVRQRNVVAHLPPVQRQVRGVAPRNAGARIANSHLPPLYAQGRQLFLHALARV